MPNPYQSPTIPAAKPGERRVKVAWGKGLMSWIILLVIADALIAAPVPPPYSVARDVLTILVNPLALLWHLFGFAGSLSLLVPGLLLGILLHAAFWTAVFTWCRK